MNKYEYYFKRVSDGSHITLTHAYTLRSDILHNYVLRRKLRDEYTSCCNAEDTPRYESVAAPKMDGMTIGKPRPHCHGTNPNCTCDVHELDDDIEFKRDLMGEFGALYYKTTQPRNMSSVRQVSEEQIEVMIKQYPELEKSQDIEIYDELHRLRHFGWQLRYIKYGKESELYLYFDKVDWRSVDYYGLKHTKYNNDKDLWWLK